MLTDDIRRRLEHLNRANLPAPCESAETAATVARRFDASHAASFPKLEDILPGVELTGATGKYFRVRRPMSEFWRQGSAMLIACQRDWPTAVDVTCVDHVELTALVRHFPHESVFLDLETCGLAGSMVFLVGLIWRDGETLVLDQLLARDYSEEQVVLETAASILERRRLLATFNGKSFDGPMILDRLARYRQSKSPIGQLMHCDLLHHARRRWKKSLPDCKLQTLERVLCRRLRRGDIPGAEIPAVYHAFVRSGDATKLSRVLEHNALDLVTLVQIALRIVGVT